MISMPWLFEVLWFLGLTVPPPDSVLPSEMKRLFPISERVVVTATYRSESTSEIPYVAGILSRRDLESRLMARTVPEALSEIGGIMVQKTSHGQGSPYFRGFTGFRNVLLVDGVRLNNSVFREGPNQYWNTIDSLSLDRVEAVRGPASVLYGSDAVGGTVQVLTTDSGRMADSGFGGRWYTRYTSGEDSIVGRLEFAGRLGTKFSYSVGGSLKDFGDVRAAGEVGVQTHTGYGERDVDLKLHYALSSATRLVATFQQVHIEDAWRSHKTIFGRTWRGTTVGNEKRRVLDQRRILGYVQLSHQGVSRFFDTLTARLSLHRQEEERDRLRRDDRHDQQGFDVASWGAALRFEKSTHLGSWTYGAESYLDQVDSFKFDLNPAGEVTRRGIQGPVADDAIYRLSGAYVQHDFTVANRLRLILGTRYTRASADANAVQDPRTGERISVRGDWDQVVGSARFTLSLGERRSWRFFGGVSQAFRAPNLSDLTRFDSARSNEIETPAPGLTPERFLSHEVGVRWHSKRIEAEVTAFYTEIDNMIVRVPTGRVIDGEFEVTRKNASSGFSRGIEASLRARFERGSIFSGVHLLDGEADTYPDISSPSVREPLDRLMPTTGHLGFRWWGQSEKTWLEIRLTVADRADRLSSRDRADTQRIPPGGTPGYETWTLRGGWEVNGRWALSAAVENLTDEEYRIHGSGLNEAGRHFVGAVRIRF